MLAILACISLTSTTAFAQRVVPHVGIGSTVHVGPPRIFPPRSIAPRPFPRRFVYPIGSFGPLLIQPGFGILSEPYFAPGVAPIFPWQNCELYSIYGCNSLPAYYVFEGQRDLVQLYMKDGTVYSVTDYWLVDNQLHFLTIDASGDKVNEQVVSFDQLDLQKTIDVDTQLGFHFVLRNEPIEQYLRDHPELNIPAPGPQPPAANAP